MIIPLRFGRMGEIMQSRWEYRDEKKREMSPPFVASGASLKANEALASPYLATG